MVEFNYCVAIRTLGTAGNKYQVLLDSLNRQTIKPKKILVYIPYGFELPKETTGREEYVRCSKGMITQRSLCFDEIDTDYILFCDDDLSLPNDFVERMYEGLMENDGDCISPDIFDVQNQSKLGMIKTAISAYAFPRKDDGWAFKVMNNSSYTYNMSPQQEFLPTESAAGACMLIKKSVYESLHFEEERWMEDFIYPLGEDLLFYYKLYVMGFKVFVYYKSGVKHLDAGSGNNSNIRDRITKNAALSVVIPHRIRYNLSHNSILKKSLIIISCALKYMEQCMFLTIRYLVKNRSLVTFSYLRGLLKGWQYIHSEKYKQIPKFDAYILPKNEKS